MAGVDFIHTDVWVSMGESKDVWTERVKVLTPYQVNAGLMRAAHNPAVKFMHCLPAFHDPNTVVGREIMEHTGMTGGLEVTGEVFNSGANIVFDQARTACTRSRRFSSPPSDNSPSMTPSVSVGSRLPIRTTRVDSAPRSSSAEGGDCERC